MLIWAFTEDEIAKQNTKKKRADVKPAPAEMRHSGGSPSQYKVTPLGILRLNTDLGATTGSGGAHASCTTPWLWFEPTSLSQEHPF